MSRSENVKQWTFQGVNFLRSKNVKEWKCQGVNFSSSELFKQWTYQGVMSNWKKFKKNFKKILKKCQAVYPKILCLTFFWVTKIAPPSLYQLGARGYTPWYTSLFDTPHSLVYHTPWYFQKTTLLDRPHSLIFFQKTSLLEFLKP